MAASSWTAADVIAAYRRAIASDRVRIGARLQRAAVDHVAAVQRAYPHGPTGTLRARVRLEARNAVSWRVLASAPHVGLFERGTRARWSRGGSGTGRGSRASGRVAFRGASPKRGPLFIPLALRARAAAVTDIQALLTRTVEV